MSNRTIEELLDSATIDVSAVRIDVYFDSNLSEDEIDTLERQQKEIIDSLEQRYGDISNSLIKLNVLRSKLQ